MLIVSGHTSYALELFKNNEDTPYVVSSTEIIRFKALSVAWLPYFWRCLLVHNPRNTLKKCYFIIRQDNPVDQMFHWARWHNKHFPRLLLGQIIFYPVLNVGLWPLTRWAVNNIYVCDFHWQSLLACFDHIAISVTGCTYQWLWSRPTIDIWLVSITNGMSLSCFLFGCR